MKTFVSGLPGSHPSRLCDSRWLNWNNAWNESQQQRQWNGSSPLHQPRQRSMRLTSHSGKHSLIDTPGTGARHLNQVIYLFLISVTGESSHFNYPPEDTGGFWEESAIFYLVELNNSVFIVLCQWLKHTNTAFDRWQCNQFSHSTTVIWHSAKVHCFSIEQVK